MVNKPKLIGISGCTNGGKTTLSKALIEVHSNALHFSQDDYYHSRDSDHLEFLEDVKLFNFDVIAAIDMVKFHKELDKVIQSGKYEYIFVDGILLYEDEKLFNMLDKKYFININKEECFRRRQTRNYIIPDTQNYFEKYVWGAFERYKLRCENAYSCITYLNGTDTVQSLFNFVSSELKALYMAEPISNTTPSISPCSSPSASLKSSTSSSPIPDSCPPTFGECEFEVAHRREILVD